MRCGSPVPSLKRGGRRGSLRLDEGLFEVSEQHGCHDALLCVDGQQGGGGLLQLQTHQHQSSTADCPPRKPARERGHGSASTRSCAALKRKFIQQISMELLSSRYIVSIKTCLQNVVGFIYRDRSRVPGTKTNFW